MKWFLWLLVLIPSLAMAQTVNFAWDPATDNPTGFKLYQSKQSGTYTTFPANPVGTFTPGTSTTGSIPKPTAWGKYYYVLTEFGLDTTVTPNVYAESGFSNEVSIVITPNKPKLNSIALAILNIPIKGIKWALGINTKKQGLRIIS